MEFFGDAVEADLKRFYNVELPDMYRGTITVRQVSIYVKYLPRGAATWTYIGGQQAWTEEVENLVLLQHLTSGLLWQGGGSQGQPPKAPDFPKGWEAEQEKMDYAVSQAEAFRRKHAK